MDTRVITVRKGGDIAAAAAQGASALRAGALVGFATETVYGIACMATDKAAMARLRDLKDRPVRPFSVHIGRREDATRYVSDLSDDARRLIQKAMPGPVTLLLPAGPKLADRKLHDHSLYESLVYQGQIGIRCPDAAVSQAMLSAVDAPVVAPSANLSGRPSPRSAEDVLKDLSGRIDLLIDTGPTLYGKDSTIIEFAPARPSKGASTGGTASSAGWRIVREGVFDERTIRRLLKRHYLFVCTGNTCRSPMAAGIARKLIAERLGCAVGDLRSRGIEVASAGLFAGDGARATPEAIDAAGELGADISRHRSQGITPELIQNADMVFCMTDAHVAEVRQIVPEAADKVRRLDEHGDIEDPIGGGRGVYIEAARKIEEALRSLLEKGLP